MVVKATRFIGGFRRVRSCQRSQGVGLQPSGRAWRFPGSAGASAASLAASTAMVLTALAAPFTPAAPARAAAPGDTVTLPDREEHSGCSVDLLAVSALRREVPEIGGLAPGWLLRGIWQDLQASHTYEWGADAHKPRAAGGRGVADQGGSVPGRAGGGELGAGGRHSAEPRRGRDGPGCPRICRLGLAGCRPWSGGAAADVLVAALLVLCVRGLVRACRRRLGTAP